MKKLNLLLASAMMMVVAEAGSCLEKVVFVCAHPDDLAGCSGTAFLLAEKFDVKVVDFTAGEGGLGEAGYRDGSTAKKRRAEEFKACAMLNTQPVFLGEVNFKGREAFAGRESTEKLRQLFEEWKPRAVILHWPLDTHPDHIQSTAAALHALHLAEQHPEIYFQEQPGQTRSFRPVYYVDITRVKERKDKLIACYECQWPDKLRRKKEEDAVFRGRGIDVDYAECFSTWEGSIGPEHKSVLVEIGARN